MKATLLLVAGLVFAILLNAPAKSNEVRCYTNSDTTGVKVPTSGGPCPKIAQSYAECLKVGMERGWDKNSLYYACTTQDYKH